jgi:hypothetical protein
MDAKDEVATTEPAVAAAPNNSHQPHHDGTKLQPLVEVQDASSSSSSPRATILHGLRLWLVIAGLYLGIYLLALELTMLSTILPTLTNEFGTLNDVSWYESAYVLAL